MNSDWRSSLFFVAVEVYATAVHLKQQKKNFIKRVCRVLTNEFEKQSNKKKEEKKTELN
jgi:hypothetical protein